MQTLSEEQKKELVQMIVENTGLRLDYYGFVEVMLGMFEDIPGFETVKQNAVSLLNELWRKYDEQKAPGTSG
ncbi:hypothetical protein [Herbaspirillum chlorophenolicum]|uniref:hypothetical protein n=1 Tax=Herbaspirillum chlorophenolicum TaxID=211589 RepID=UPI0009E4D052|nr:hypothetical protein [Herbaspirillum chlorophenolicum]